MNILIDVFGSSLDVKVAVVLLFLFSICTYANVLSRKGCHAPVSLLVLFCAAVMKVCLLTVLTIREGMLSVLHSGREVVLLSFCDGVSLPLNLLIVFLMADVLIASMIMFLWCRKVLRSKTPVGGGARSAVSRDKGHRGCN